MHPSRDLSKRERQLVELASHGFTDQEIALKLGISPGTVATYWGRIRAKYGGSSRTELVVLIMKEHCSHVITKLRTRTADLSSRIRHVSGDLPEGNFYRQLFDQDPEAIICVDENGLIDNMNEAACELFGYTREELHGKPIETLVAERFRLIHAQHREKYLEQPVKKEMGKHALALARHRSGREFPILAILAAIKTGEGPIIACFIHPAHSAASGSSLVIGA